MPQTLRLQTEETMTIRLASVDDAEEILEIYAPYVLNTAITFEYEVPKLEAFKERIANTLKKYPYLVAEEHGSILGYAYAGAFHPREAYNHGAELSIYLKDGERKKGIGRALYEKMESFLITQNVYTVYACIAVPPTEDDPHLTNGSVLFHQRMGFKTIGTFESCGYKFNRWYNMVWMEKRIREIIPIPEHFLPFNGTV